MNEVVREFLLETHENLAQLDLDLVTLEKEPTQRETPARVFRTPPGAGRSNGAAGGAAGVPFYSAPRAASANPAGSAAPAQPGERGRATTAEDGSGRRGRGHEPVQSAQSGALARGTGRRVAG